MARVRTASLASAADATVEQVQYLARYLDRLGAQTLVLEDRYVDRHFIEEYALYYSRCLSPPPNYCRRVHLFSSQFDDEALDGHVIQGLDSRDAKEDVEKKLSDAYLGFVVVRPLPDVPIGRTVLKPLEDEPDREIFATSTHDVHFLGLRLHVTGLAFIQQDRAVGACATAAVWMAMARAARFEGARAPTPAFIAEAAGRLIGEEGRLLPSRGLSTAQVVDAVRQCGFAPEVLRVGDRPEEFVSALYWYLRSGIPAVLVIDGPDGPHAVTAVGYKIGLVGRNEFRYLFPLRSDRIEKLYVHDDSLGPYARAKINVLAVAATGEAVSPSALFLEIDRDDLPDGVAPEPPAQVRMAVIPVYAKLRVSSEDVWPMASRFESVVEEWVGAPGATCEIFFVRGGSYSDELVSLRMRGTSYLARRMMDFLREVATSRWVCVVRWWSPQDEPLVDFIYDTTEVVRNPQMVQKQLLGVVAHDPNLRTDVDLVGSATGAVTL